MHTDCVIRPCFLVVDHEYPGSISSRKLVLETAKYNVITAYSVQEAIDTFREFPSVSGIVINEAMEAMGDVDGASLLAALRAIREDVLIVMTLSDHGAEYDRVDHHVRNFDPAALLDLLRRQVPNPFKA